MLAVPPALHTSRADGRQRHNPVTGDGGSSSLVGSRKSDPEVPREFSHIGAILIVGFVSQVGCDLTFNRAAPDGNTIDAADRRRRVMPSRDPIKLDLVTASIVSRLNGMEIDAHSIPVTEREGGGQPVSFYQKPAGLEDPAAYGNGGRTYNKVKIIVLPCLTPQERIDSPTSVDPGLHPCGLKLGEHG